MNKQVKTVKKNISKFVILIVMVLCLMVPLFYLFGSPYIKFLMPLISFAIEKIHPEYEILMFKIESLGESKKIFYKVNIHRLYTDNQGIIRTYRTVTGNIYASTLYIQPIIIYSLLWAWPALSVKNKVKATAISLPLLIISELIDIPIHLINQMETFSPVDSVSSRLRVLYTNFLAIGGRQFLALLVFSISLAPFLLNMPVIPESDIKRNDPCPCGSGKKYKKCCQN